MTKLTMAAVATAATLAAGSAFADATITVCTGANGTNCVTDTVSLSTGGTINQCVDGARVTKSISSAGGQRSVTDALTGMYNMALQTAEAVERDGIQVTGFQAEMEGCTGSWAPYCTTITVGEVNVDGVRQSSPNNMVEALTGREAESCGIFSNQRHTLVPLPR